MAVKLLTLDEITVTSAGQRTPLSNTSQMVYSVEVQSLYTNTGYQYIGNNKVSSSNGHIFEASDVAEIEGPPSSKGQEEFDLADIYLDTSIAPAKFRVSAWTRK